MSNKANSVKAETIVYVVLALLVPLWPISLPLFLWQAHKSYKKGDAGDSRSGNLDDVHKAKQLLDAGAITQTEFETIKNKALYNESPVSAGRPKP